MRKWSALLALAGLVALVSVVWSADAPSPERRANAQKAYKAGNYKDAYELFRNLALDPQNDPKLVGDDLNMATACLANLGRINEQDDLREKVITTHKTNWRLLWSAAENYLSAQHYGFIIAGEFERGRHRGGGRYVNSFDRDRTRALQLMQQGLENLNGDDQRGKSDFYMAFSRILLANRGYSEAWRLQYLTDLSKLPDYENGWYYGNQSQGAPVDAEGNPIYHHIPKSYKEAKTDGERWRWALLQAMELAPSRTNEVRWEFAQFCLHQFGSQTMASYGQIFGRQADTEGKNESGTYALHTLKEDETIAKLASGVKRFTLPDEFNYIKVFQQIAADPKTGYGDNSLEALAQIFENRRQYPRAAEYWREVIKKHGPGNNNYRQKRLDQIVDDWGRFEPVMKQPAGKGATVEFRFRNAKHVAFEANELKIDEVLADVKGYLKSNPPRLDWNKVNIGNIGSQIVHNNQTKYVGKKVANWELDLEPRPNHWDKRITVATPLVKAGAYMLTARVEGGNVSKIIIWVSDTAIVKQALDGGKSLIFVADARDGSPVAKANVEFFGYRQIRVKQTNRYDVKTSNYAEFTDADGLLMPTQKEMPNDYNWLITARNDDGRLAYLGFTNVWYPNYHDYEYNQTKVFTITDRPVYRPNNTVNYKFWVRHAKYDQEDKSSFAGQDFRVEVMNPKQEKILETTLKADEYGGLEGKLELSSDATLGVYQVYVKGIGGGSFRVEEYKKPEFEVNVEAPKEPIMLGEKVTALVNCRYYFGAPVQNAKVKYKVLRTSQSEQWFPVMPWDWMYGPGYWWFGQDYDWYPGWRKWGCRAPIPWWYGQRYTPPEVVAEGEMALLPDGTLPIEIDTTLAKELHPDLDHKYQVVAEVTDESRRTIVGQGNILVARKPFKVYAWVNRGYYRTGQTIHAHFNAHTLDQKPVEGQGVLKLLKISYDKDSKPVESEVQQWKLPTNAQGEAEMQINAAEPGQYRLSYALTDGKEHTIEGGYVFTIMGEKLNSADFRFNAVELVNDKREYAPGENVKLQVNTNQSNSTVLLFVRPANGVYLPPKVLRIKGKTAVEEVAVVTKDMPNFFVEAFTVSGSQVYREAKEIVVPPAKRVLDVKVEPSSENYRPGEKGTVKITLKDAEGKPFVGSTVVSIYDKSVEYISGGSNVPEIKEFFWKWRRRHNTQYQSNLQAYFYNLTLKNATAMGDLGVFGWSVADEKPGEAKGFGGGGGEGHNANELRRDRGRAVAKSASVAPGAAMADGLAMQQEAQDKRKEVAEGGGAAQQPNLVEATVRKNFADTALWVASLKTDADGVATVDVDMPENLTTWKVRVWGMGHGTKVGQGEAEVVTKKDLIVRLQAPRFFVEKDEVVLSANVHNYLKQKKAVQVSLELEGKTLVPMDKSVVTVDVDANGEHRVDFRVKVTAEGEAIIRMKALTDVESDAVQMSFPVFVHGMMKMESWAGVIRPDEQTASVKFRVPEERRINESRLEVRYSPTLAGAMVDALPYLVDYPYGCTEQTLNRFLPTVITQKILLDMNLDLAAIRDKRTNLNAQEIGDDKERAKGWKRYDRNPVFDQAEVNRMVKDGLKRLTEMQLSDGGWGWFSGYGERSWPHTTAYVVHGLQTAQHNDVALVPGTLEEGVAWLRRYQDQQVQMLKNAPTKTKPWKEKADNLDAFVYMVLVDADVKNDDMRTFLYRDRTNLAVYCKAMFGLALHKQKDQEKLDMILQNISQYVVEDNENQTAYLQLPPDNYWWYWYGSENEAHGYYLKLLSKTDPKGRLASRLVKYVLNNRKHGTYWNSTRDTAICIEALAEYLVASGENKPDMTVQVWLDGKQQKEVSIKAQDLFTFDNKFVLFGDAVTTGDHKLEIKREGEGPVYFNAYLSNFTLEDPITKAGLEVKVERKFYKLIPEDKEIKVAGSRGQAVGQKVEKYRREPIANLATLTSGDLVEVELEIQSKNDYEYLMFEDMKAAGFEPVDVRSGYNGNDMGAYMELRDERVTFFVRWLARGKHSVSYRLRAEIPGKFSALPARASAMYAPELKANSDELKMLIVD